MENQLVSSFRLTFYQEVDAMLRRVRADHDEYKLMCIMGKCSIRAGMVMTRTPADSDKDAAFEAAKLIESEGIARITINASPYSMDDARAIKVAHRLLSAAAEGKYKEVVAELGLTREELSTLLLSASLHADVVLREG